MVVTNQTSTKVAGLYNTQRVALEAANASKQVAKATANDSVAVVLNLSQQALGATVKSSTRTVSTYSSSSSTLQMGSRGSAVTALQKNLTELGYDTKGTDGIFGNNTKNAVVAFQQAYGLDADGIVGPATQTQINKSLYNHRNNILLMGSRGDNVQTLQENLTALGYNTKGADGIFGQNTENAVIAFQRAHNLTADGIVGANTHKAINNALKALNETDSDSGNLTASQSEMIQNLRNDTSLGLSASKKTAMITAAERLLSEGYEVEFVAGVLGNIQNEGTPGKFESSNYSNPNARPAYLKYMDAHFNYRNEFSGKTISQVGIDKAVALQEKVIASGYQGKFGFGMVQWTGSRTTGVLEAYEKYCTSNYPTEAECAKAEANYLVDELQGAYSYVYENWKGGAQTAKSAGEIVCRQYEVPANTAVQATLRGQNAERIYDVMMQ
ncbi:MAG: peptidoglycan-binding protein [Lachnospiraceae bacterium]|nr:peptidoglycan-binding protein [Lachnospiraceae bacterium]